MNRINFSFSPTSIIPHLVSLGNISNRWGYRSLGGNRRIVESWTNCYRVSRVSHVQTTSRKPLRGNIAERSFISLKKIISFLLFFFFLPFSLLFRHFYFYFFISFYFLPFSLRTSDILPVSYIFFLFLNIRFDEDKYHSPLLRAILLLLLLLLPWVTVIAR